MNDQRYLIYRLREEKLYLLAETDEAGLGIALVTMGGEGEFDGCSVGILDGKERTWVLNPFAGKT